LEFVACNLCGSTNYSKVYEIPDLRFFPEERFTVVECNNCGLGYVNPRPTFAEMSKYYPANYYHMEPPSEMPAFRRRRCAGKLHFVKQFEEKGKRKKLLDVGSGSGDFLQVTSARGWQVEGVEISPHAPQNPEYKIYRQEFQNIPVDDPTYDVVTAWAVLEHIHDPMSYFRKAARVLKPGGHFIFLVPNFGSMASRHLFIEDVPRHLYFFTREAAKQYVEKCGMALQYEVNGRSIYKAAPANWLTYLLQTRVRGKPYTFSDAPLSSREYRKVHGLSKGIEASLKYLWYSPVSVLERILFPVVEGVEILRKTYGVSTYVAEKK
jgi:SAM-dependent methyltransferase